MEGEKLKINVAEEWTKREHDETPSNFEELEVCSDCDSWCTKEEIQQLGRCWKCDKRRT